MVFQLVLFLLQPRLFQGQGGIAHEVGATIERVALASKGSIAKGVRLTRDGGHQFLIDFLLLGKATLVEDGVIEGERVGTGHLRHRNHLPDKTVGKPDGIGVVLHVGNGLRHPRRRLASTVVRALCQAIEAAHGRQGARNQFTVELGTRDTTPSTHALRHRLAHLKHAVADALRLTDTTRSYTTHIVSADDVVHALRSVHVDIYTICHYAFLLAKIHGSPVSIEHSILNPAIARSSI